LTEEHDYMCAADGTLIEQYTKQRN